ncbi:hypothetical protein CLOP_g20922 [Closterium sp. NIES-67]|nr:hypothetical protein CLOP_g20922 [Closterium sp. NIES-67]
MTPRADLLDEVKPPGKIKYVAAASGALLPVIGVGNAKVKGANGELVGLGNVLLVEGFAEQMLEMQFKCSKMGEVKYYLGMHVERDVEKGVLRLHQRKYSMKIQSS